MTRNFLKISLMSLVSCFISSCSLVYSFVPTQTPFPTYTPYPTQTPYPTSTPIPSPTQTPENEVLFELTDFSGSAMCLPEYQDGPNNNFVEDDGYHMLVDSTNWFGLAYCDKENYADLIIEVEAQQVGGPRENEYGVAFRFSEEDGYLYTFTISNDGYYALGVNNITTDDDFYVLLGGPLSFISGNSPNHLKVIAKDDRFELFVNGHFVGLVHDNILDFGKVGLYVGAFDQGSTEVVFNNFKISAP